MSVRVKVIDTPKYEVTMELSEWQAAGLLAMCGSIGGDSNHTVRGVFDKLSAALYGAGVRRDDTQVQDNRSYYFRSTADR